jgi:hypothetical protein
MDSITFDALQLSLSCLAVTAGGFFAVDEKEESIPPFGTRKEGRKK